MFTIIDWRQDYDNELSPPGPCWQLELLLSQTDVKTSLANRTFLIILTVRHRPVTTILGSTSTNIMRETRLEENTVYEIL